jgi:hypothetical protein
MRANGCNGVYEFIAFTWYFLVRGVVDASGSTLNYPILSASRQTDSGCAAPLIHARGAAAAASCGRCKG